jgi:hypothetical protein
MNITKFSYLRLLLALLATVSLLASCGLSRPYPLVRTFSLELPPDGGETYSSSVKKPFATVLVTASPPPAAYESKKLVYKLSATEFYQDFYDEFQTPPARALADGFAKYLDYSSANYTFVRSQGVRPPEYALEIRLTDFYGDLSSEPLSANIALSATLNDLRPNDPKLIFVRNYVKKIPIKGRVSEDDRATFIVAAFIGGLTEIIKDLDADLRSYLKGPKKR